MAKALLADVHAHLDDGQFEQDLPAVLERAAAAGVRAIVCNGLSPASNRAVLALSQEYPLIKPAYGIGPSEALKLSDEEIAAELAWIQGQECVALGEIGLDRKWSVDKTEHTRQEKVFGQLLELAKKMKKPVIIHSRKAEAECIAMLAEAGLKRAIFHCFGGRLSLVREIRDAGWHFSIPPSILRDEHFQRIVQEVPVKQILTETDSPYQGPERGGRNEPANVRLVVEKIAGLKEQTFEETANQIFANYLKQFS